MVEGRLYRLFFSPLHIAPLVTFRIVFGVLMLISTLRFMYLGWIEDHYAAPVFHFKYYGFEWVEPLSTNWLYALHVLLALASVGVALGFFYRVSAVLVFLLFTYFELIDLTYYLNHYYFVSLVSGIMMFLPAHRYFSLDAWRKPSLLQSNVPAWCIRLLMLQLGLVYFYAGLAKINSTWLLDALPLKIWLPAHDDLPIIGEMMQWPATPYIFSWFGMLYDVSIPFFLLWKRTRLFAYLAVIVFHTITGLLFQIGVFPVVMIGATLIFFSAEWHQNLIRRLKNILPQKKIAPIAQGTFPNRPFVVAAVGMYVIFQIVFPWRFLFYNGNMYWTEQGYRFGWRVMLMEKAGTATFYVKDLETGKKSLVLNSDFLNHHQEKQMAMQPDMILQYAHFLGEIAQKQGVKNPAVHAEVYVTLNGKPSQLYFSDTLNLLTIQDSWKEKDWLFAYED